MMREPIARPISIVAVVCVALALVTAGCLESRSSQPGAPVTAAPAASQPGDPLASFKAGSAAIIATYLREQPIRRLQIGAGSSRRPGWLNTDIEPGDGLAFLDATQRFPFEDGSLHYIFSEHVIEHLTYDEGKAMMAEAHRVLAPGGKMRVSTPDLARFIDLFDEHPSEDAKAYLVGKMQWHDWPNEPNQAAIVLNLQMSSWGHKFLYDFGTLGGALTRAGFRNVREFEQNIGSDEHLTDLEERDTGVNARWNDYETMSVEAEKPRASPTSR